ncbi:MAG: hypothetical protein JJU02_01565 [Cryomorphaceae bacterium]|nr:hypothetical protein [Cryomorphaceae bacterium]
MYNAVKTNEKGCAGLYRYGFSTQEKVDEVKDSGGHYTAEFWEYDPRLGRRWNLDPVVVAWESSYAVFRNNPIVLNDPDGDCPEGCDGTNTTTHRSYKYEGEVDGKHSHVLTEVIEQKIITPISETERMVETVRTETTIRILNDPSNKDNPSEVLVTQSVSSRKEEQRLYTENEPGYGETSAWINQPKTRVNNYLDNESNQQLSISEIRTPIKDYYNSLQVFFNTHGYDKSVFHVGRFTNFATDASAFGIGALSGYVPPPYSYLMASYSAGYGLGTLMRTYGNHSGKIMILK